MSEKRRALGRGLGALIPTSPGTARPVDVFFRESTPPPPTEDETGISARQQPNGSHHDGGSEHRTPGPESGADNRHENGYENRYEAHDGSSGNGAHDGHDVLEAELDAASDSARERAHVEPGDVDLAPVPGATFAILPIAAIGPNPRQPRTVFDEDELAELAASIREIGVLQPVVVRPITRSDDQSEAHTEPDGVAGEHGTERPRFELIMGERRLRASQLAGQDTIPAIVKDTHDDDLLRDALLENLHRSQLNPLEEAAAYQQLLDDFGCSHDELATRIGRSRPQISNTIRLLRLPPLVARRLAAGVLSAGHARALLGLDDGAAMERLAQRIVAEGLSVRSVEEIVAVGGDDPQATPRPRRPRAGNRRPQLDDVAARLSDRYDTRVTIALGQRKGRLTVEFASVEDLNRIVGLMERV
ncbi:MAG: ParB/RepB/Spo0J family partition protein [Lapillicoccus sp.]